MPTVTSLASLNFDQGAELQRMHSWMAPASVVLPAPTLCARPRSFSPKLDRSMRPRRTSEASAASNGQSDRLSCSEARSLKGDVTKSNDARIKAAALGHSLLWMALHWGFDWGQEDEQPVEVDDASELRPAHLGVSRRSTPKPAPSKKSQSRRCHSLTQADAGETGATVVVTVADQDVASSSRVGGGSVALSASRGASKASRGDSLVATVRRSSRAKSASPGPRGRAVERAARAARNSSGTLGISKISASSFVPPRESASTSLARAPSWSCEGVKGPPPQRTPMPPVQHSSKQPLQEVQNRAPHANSSSDILHTEACRKPESTVKAAVTVSAEPLSDRVTKEAPEPSPSGPGTTPRVAESAEACPVPSSASTAATETDIDHSPRVLRPLKSSASQEPNSRNATTTPRRAEASPAPAPCSNVQLTPKPPSREVRRPPHLLGGTHRMRNATSDANMSMRSDGVQAARTSVVSARPDASNDPSDEVPPHTRSPQTARNVRSQTDLLLGSVEKTRHRKSWDVSHNAQRGGTTPKPSSDVRDVTPCASRRMDSTPGTRDGVRASVQKPAMTPARTSGANNSSAIQVEASTSRRGTRNVESTTPTRVSRPSWSSTGGASHAGTERLGGGYRPSTGSVAGSILVDPPDYEGVDPGAKALRTMDAQIVEEICSMSPCDLHMLLSMQPSKETRGTWMVWMVHRVYLNDPTLERLDFTNCGMPTGRQEHRIAPKLVEALAENMHLKHLRLSNSNLHSCEAAKLALSLTKNSTLSTLEIECNHLEPSDLQCIIEALAGNTCLQDLRCSGQFCMQAGPRVFQAVKETLESNRTLRRLGMEITDAHWRHEIHRAMSKNKDQQRRQMWAVGDMWSPRF